MTQTTEDNRRYTVSNVTSLELVKKSIGIVDPMKKIESALREMGYGVAMITVVDRKTGMAKTIEVFPYAQPLTVSR